MKKILFQGDSITDCGRSREEEKNKGRGYATMVAGRIGYEYPGVYEFMNRGISGNRVVDLYARIGIDIVNLKPDYMSILIGVNDVWHKYLSRNEVKAEKFEKIYDMLITEVKEELPDIKIMILEPFTTRGTANDDKWEEFSSEVAKRAEASKRIAKKHELVFVPLQEKFNEMLKRQPEPYWTAEGVHPTEMGHELIAREWVKGFEKLNK